jgi:hypothetical protein
MWKQLKFSSDGNSASKKCKRGYGGVWLSTFGGSLESGSQFCVGAFGSCHQDVFTFDSLYKEIL